MNNLNNLFAFARDIEIGASIQEDDGIQLAKNLESFLLQSDPSLHQAKVHFISYLGDPVKKIRILLYRTFQQP
jgi:hypothetical protein